MTVLVCLAVQAFAQDPLGLGSSGSSMGSGGDWISPNMGMGSSGSSMGSSGDWISPNMGLSYPTNWMEGNKFYYPGPFGVYPYDPEPYYSDFRLNSLAGMNWEPFQKNWSQTMDYAQTKSSFRAYQGSSYTNPPIQSLAPTYITAQSPAATTGDSTATIVSKGMRGYQIFLDGNYIGTEGTGGDPLDGKFSFRVVGNQNHDIRVYDGQFNYPKTMFFERGGTKIINVEPGMAVYV